MAIGLTSPRSIQFDGSGSLLVVEQSKGVTSLQFDDNAGICVSVKSRHSVVETTSVISTSLVQKYPYNDLKRSSPMVAGRLYPLGIISGGGLFMGL